MILDFDIDAYEQGGSNKATQKKVLESLQTGFIYVNHGMDQSFIDDIYLLLADFFNMETASKQSNSHYSKMGSEKAEISDIPDFKEMLNWKFPPMDGHPLVKKYPNTYKPFDSKHLNEDLLRKFSTQVLNIQVRVLRVIAEALGADKTYFDRMVNHGPTLTRAIHYPAAFQDEIWAAEHDDINLITALPRATTKGLQIKIDGEWVDASPPEDAMIINTGIMMDYVTNGVIPAGRHRVMPDGSGEERYSIVQFCHPTPGTVLAPMHVCVTPDNPQKHDPVLAEELLQEVIWRITNE